MREEAWLAAYRTQAPPLRPRTFAEENLARTNPCQESGAEGAAGGGGEQQGRRGRAKGTPQAGQGPIAYAVLLPSVSVSGVLRDRGAGVGGRSREGRNATDMHGPVCFVRGLGRCRPGGAWAQRAGRVCLLRSQPRSLPFSYVYQVPTTSCATGPRRAASAPRWTSHTRRLPTAPGCPVIASQIVRQWFAKGPRFGQLRPKMPQLASYLAGSGH